MKQIREEKICTFSQLGSRLQLLFVVFHDNILNREVVSYQVRLNRKVMITTCYEPEARKEFIRLVVSNVNQINLS